ncbi:COQ9 family protein [Acidisphaera sp. L21]|uniref:COQ9 family protein n=1 Tax=Acidisphaera sp. L21 TaxID=1641851 RepID=UPI00131C814B|nr:COQ9 family protein [Acidisphaera sp. L21]
MTHPERSDERDAALDALVATIPFPGWTMAALRAAAGSDADLLFPGGITDMVESWADLTDRRMPTPTDDRLPDRVRSVIAQRLASLRPAKDAVRRAVAITAAHPASSARVTARTVDAIWHAAGDRSADWSWYTKRAILAGVYGATLLFWLRDDSEDNADTLAFLDRRLAGLGRLGRLRRKSDAILQWLRPTPAD